MPHQTLADGLYLLKQGSPEKGVDHYGILDIGNRLGRRHASEPVVIHQTPPAIRFDWLRDTGHWAVLGKVTDEAAALERIRIALMNPRYDLFGHNCEHFARFVATGRRESTQLQWVVGLVGMVGVVVWAAGGKRAA